MSITTEPESITQAGRSGVAARRERFSEERRKGFLVALLLMLMVGVALVALTVGAYKVSVLDVFRVIGGTIGFNNSGMLDQVQKTVVWEIRLPRIIVAVLVGFALSIAGTVYQGTFRNPLVEPFILGISAGASFGAALGILYPEVFWSHEVAAFLFALVAVAIVYFSSRIDGRNPIVSLILSGVIVSSLFQALVSILKYLSDDSALRAIVFWIMGGFYYAGWGDVSLLTPAILLTAAGVWLLSWRLNVLTMGEDEARSLGVNPEQLKLVLIILATAMTAFAVAAVGIIAWVGLMMPHAARMLLGPDHRFVIPAAALMGGIYLLLCDTLARTLTGAEIPISIVTSLLGAPYLFYLLRTRSRAGYEL